MVESIAGTGRFSLSGLTPILWALAATAAVVASASAQATQPLEEADSAIEWTFRPTEVAPSSAALQERWAAPFAVEATGHPAAREPRTVVVLRDSAAARRAASAQVAVGASAAEVTVERAGEPSAASGEASKGASATPGGTGSARNGASAARGAGGVTPAGSAARDVSGSPAPISAPNRASVSPPESPRNSSPAATRPAAAAAASGTHRVEYGETWYGIARQYKVSSRELAAANPDVDPERLRSGTTLRLPQPEGAAPAARTHKVSRGDTLYGIAQRYGVSAAALRTANRMTDDIVRLGQTLLIPREEASR